MGFSFSRCKSIVQKESKHIARDPFVIILALFIPLFMVIVFGNSIEFNLKNISAVVVDHDKSKESADLVETFNSSGYFKTYFKESPEEAIAEVEKENARVALIIPPDFDNKISSEKQAEVQILLDGADNSSVTAVLGYISTIGGLATKKILNKKPQKNFLEVRFLFNPELNTKWFMIPGLTAVIIAIVSILLTSLTVCREQEQGSMELLLSTPVKPTEIMAGKILPYAFLGWIGFGIVYVAARFLYEVPFYGDFWILFLGTAIFIFDYLALGLFISAIAKQQQLAVQMAMGIGLLPTVLLSGFIFPIEYMPDIMQYVTMIFPARWYIEIARCEFLKASSFIDLLLPFSALTIQGIVIITAAVAKFRNTLE